MFNSSLAILGLKFGRYILYITMIISLSAGGCNPEKQWKQLEITGYIPRLSFSLMSGSSQDVTDQNNPGSTHVVLL